MSRRRSTWPNGRIPRQPVKTKDIDVRESGWFKYASPWKQAEMLASENNVGRRKK